MHTVCETLPAPKLDARPCGARRVSMLTDDALFQACGVRIAFTGRDGGSSQGPFASLNLGAHVQDNLDHVMENRRLAMQALDGEGVPVIVPNQVHGTEIVSIHASDAASVVAAQQRAQAAADALVVTASNVAAMLCLHARHRGVAHGALRRGPCGVARGGRRHRGFVRQAPSARRWSENA